MLENNSITLADSRSCKIWFSWYLVQIYSTVYDLQHVTKGPDWNIFNGNSCLILISNRLEASIFFWPEVQLTSNPLHSGQPHNRNPWKLKTKISPAFLTMVMCCPIACNFNGNSCLVLLLNKFPASCELLRVLPALGFCFDLSLCNLHLLIMRLILFPRIVSNSIKTMYNISSDQTRQKNFWWSGLFLDISNGCAQEYTTVYMTAGLENILEEVLSDTVPVCLLNNWTYGPGLRDISLIDT